MSPDRRRVLWLEGTERRIGNLAEAAIEVHRDPAGGRSGSLATASKAAEVAPAAFAVRVDALIP